MFENPVGEFCPFPRKLGKRQRIARNRERRAAGLHVNPAQTPPKVRPIPRLPTHGGIPDPADGWMPDRPSEDPKLRLVRIFVVRFDDGHTQKFYLMRTRTEDETMMYAERFAERMLELCEIAQLYT